MRNCALQRSGCASGNLITLPRRHKPEGSAMRAWHRTSQHVSGPRILITALAVIIAFAVEARAQETRIDRLEIVESGFYDKTQVKVTGSTPAPGTAFGRVDQLGDFSLLKEPPAVSARVGIGFGVRFRSFG